MGQPVLTRRSSATRSPETPATVRRLRATQEASAASPLSRLGALAASSPQVAQARRLRSLPNGVGQGRDIHQAPGQEHHLPHEAWPLVQQAQGRVRPTLQLQGGVAVNDDPALEREADHMGARAAALRAH
jgi:hypothetical protein